MHRVIAPRPDSPSSQAVGVDFDETLMFPNKTYRGSIRQTRCPVAASR
ncbi:hypothetical protein GCM10009760_52990 [Kitasatospora kazusensis]|uniref:5'-nucleotidase n=1 Tax=Kitasatospora kazusensis TaxID=407974 RepID=A0ABP5LYW8_9ACTN